MDQARIATTDEIVDATDLLAWDPDLVQRTDFTCPSILCSAKLAACAWRPGQKVRPYFSAKWGHATGCDVDGRVKLVDPPERPDDPEPLEVVAGYVAKLVLSDVRRIQSPQPPADSDETEPVSEPQSATVTDQNTVRLGTCRTIRTLCSTFLHNPPELRAAMKLDVPGVDATRYATGFRRLERFEIRRYAEQRIFYAPIRWSAEPTETPRALTIDLYCGDNDPSGLLGLARRINSASTGRTGAPANATQSLGKWSMPAAKADSDTHRAAKRAAGPSSLATRTPQIRRRST
ncbi:hypothetical protein [Nocardia asiatica]|uniref:hypothetical protein n=1 Tax=Nocardia asiatica TaxID=209252 RepID=UPI0005BD84CD|nr:hypothetical protein [Nocardia asiatica]